jgi:hypothetical protein
MKSELLKLRNELISMQLIVKLLQEESDNRSSAQGNIHNLTNSVEDEMNQRQLPSAENSWKLKQAQNKRNTTNLTKKTPILNQQKIPVVTTSNRYEQLPKYQGRSEVNKTKDLRRCTRRVLVTSRILIIGDSHVRGCSEKLMNSLGKADRVIGITKPMLM